MTSQACSSSADSSSRFPSPSPPTASPSASSPGQGPWGACARRGVGSGEAEGWEYGLACDRACDRRCGFASLSLVSSPVGAVGSPCPGLPGPQGSEDTVARQSWSFGYGASVDQALAIGLVLSWAWRQQIQSWTASTWPWREPGGELGGAQRPPRGQPPEAMALARARWASGQMSLGMAFRVGEEHQRVLGVIWGVVKRLA